MSSITADDTIESRALSVREWLESATGRRECSRLVARFGPSDGYLIMHAIRRTSTEKKYESYEELTAIVAAVHRQRMAEAVARRRTPCEISSASF